MGESQGVLDQVLYYGVSASSILAFFITVWILINLGRIRSDFLFRARAPELKKKVSQHSAELNKHLRDFDNSREQIDLEFGKCRANLKSLKSKLPQNSKKTVNALDKLIRKASAKDMSRDEVWKIYKDLLSLIEEVKNLEQDKYWERS